MRADNGFAVPVSRPATPMTATPTSERVRRLLFGVLLAAAAGAPAEPLVIPVTAAPKPVVVDGELGEWPAAGWVRIPVAPAVENDDKNRTGKPAVELQARVGDGHLYVAARWADDGADREYRSWQWRNGRYQRGKEQDDLVAVRFFLDGRYDSCMLSEHTYKVDVWVWSAGRSDPTGVAEDMWHFITMDPQESAAEYEKPGGGTVYIRKGRDSGTGPYATVRPPREKGAEELASTAPEPAPAGGAADVRAKGVWRDGQWSVEFSRLLDTGDEDDARFASGQKRLGAVGVFNKGYAEHKSVSGDLLFDFSAL